MTQPAPVTITLGEATGNPELEGLAHIHSILEHFEPHQRERMLNWLCEVFLVDRFALKHPNAELTGNNK
jgi:hypothetical protein